MVSSGELGTNQLNALIRATELWKSSKKTNQIHQENKKFRNKLFRQKKNQDSRHIKNTIKKKRKSQNS